MVMKKVRVPLMIDSTDHKVIEMALTYCQGKAIINSVNLEDGEERFEKVVPLARRFGAALVVGSIDEKGMAVTRQRKLEVAERSFELLTEQYGVRAGGSLLRPARLPLRLGRQGTTSAARWRPSRASACIKQRFPQCKTVLGISNVSFGLPTAGREVLNSVFLYHCVQAGLDLALVNAEKLERYPQIPDEEKQLCEDLLYNRGGDPIDALRRALPREEADRAAPPRHSSRSTSGSVATSSKARATGSSPTSTRSSKTRQPLDIINGPLMKGMDEVGRLFGANELIVAEVLQSAEAMKAAVSLPRAVHGQGGDLVTRESGARHRQGRRARHRQEPGGDHLRQQRLRGGQPGHQGPARSSSSTRCASTSPTSSASRGCW